MQLSDLIIVQKYKQDRQQQLMQRLTTGQDTESSSKNWKRHLYHTGLPSVLRNTVGQRTRDCMSHSLKQCFLNMARPGNSQHLHEIKTANIPAWMERADQHPPTADGFWGRKSQLEVWSPW